jgi:hypothetical protein
VQIVNFGHFTVVNPDNRILYYRNEDGQDWYELRRGLTSWELENGDFVDAVFGAWVTVDPEGVIIHVEYNPSRLVPDDKTILGIDADHKDIVKGMRWNGKKLLPPTRASLEKVGPQQ